MSGWLAWRLWQLCRTSWRALQAHSAIVYFPGAFPGNQFYKHMTFFPADYTAWFRNINHGIANFPRNDWITDFEEHCLLKEYHWVTLKTRKLTTAITLLGLLRRDEITVALPLWLEMDHSELSNPICMSGCTNSFSQCPSYFYCLGKQYWIMGNDDWVWIYWNSNNGASDSHPLPQSRRHRKCN